MKQISIINKLTQGNIFMRNIKSKILTMSIGAAIAVMVSGCATTTKEEVKQVAVDSAKDAMLKVSKKDILRTYADMALVSYTDSLNDAKNLQVYINAFVKSPNAKTFKNAKLAWLKSRESYGQSEIFRLSNTPIDAEEGWVEKAYGNLEGQINAWPLDENMIDYTIDAKGKRTKGNIIDTMGKFTPVSAEGEKSKAVNVSKITKEAITDLNENGGEANVASGYHAIEFLLWGQDQDYNSMMADKVTHGAMKAGNRPLKDFTTDKFSKRRKAYLKAATDKLVDDLTTVTKAWSTHVSTNCDKDATGCYRGALLGQLKGSDASKNIPYNESLKSIFGGMGMFIKSELANERIAVAVLTPSEEDEHSCFSDNTHRDILTNYLGFRNVLLGTYEGKKFGKTAYDNLDMVTKKKIDLLMAKIEGKILLIDKIAKTSRHFDHQIYPNDPQSKVIIKLKNELRKLGDEMINVAKANNISLSVEDVTDAEETKL